MRLRGKVTHPTPTLALVGVVTSNSDDAHACQISGIATMGA
jgi:hypothetical protein